MVWKWCNDYQDEREDTGVYLICDGGYVHWPELISPIAHKPVASKKVYFSSKVEGIQKDVECVFGIMKKRWRILDYGIHFKDMEEVERAFMVAAFCTTSC